MRELYCKKCGKKINTKLWMVPNSCVCGVNLDEWQKDSGRITFRYLLCLFLLMLPLFLLIYLLRILLKNLIILYALIILISMIWLRQADGQHPARRAGRHRDAHRPDQHTGGAAGCAGRHRMDTRPPVHRVCPLSILPPRDCNLHFIPSHHLAY